MSLFSLYLIVTLPAIGKLLFGLAVTGTIISLCVLIFTGMGFMTMDTPSEKETRDKLASITKMILKVVAPFIILPMFVVGTLIPDKDNLYTIIGGYYVTNIDGIEDIPPSIVGAMNKFLEEYSQKPQN